MIARCKAWLARRRTIKAIVDEVCRSFAALPMTVGDQSKRVAAALAIKRELAERGIAIETSKARCLVARWERRERRRLRNRR